MSVLSTAEADENWLKCIGMPRLSLRVLGAEFALWLWLFLQETAVSQRLSRLRLPQSGTPAEQERAGLVHGPL